MGFFSYGLTCLLLAVLPRARWISDPTIGLSRLGVTAAFSRHFIVFREFSLEFLKTQTPDLHLRVIYLRTDRFVCGMAITSHYKQNCQHKMGEFVRTLTFRSRNLGRNSTLLLTFNDDSTPGMYKTVFPIAWKVTVFEATGLHEFPVTYVHKLGFTRAVINGAVLDPPSTYTNINVGQRTELSKSGHPATYEFSTPQTITPPTKESVATNVTNGSENIGVCFFNSPTGPPSELLVFEDVKAGLSVHSEFTPILRAYVTTEFCQNEVMKGHSITPVLFRENLVDLPENSNWLLRWIVGPGNYIIERDLSHYWDY